MKPNYEVVAQNNRVVLIKDIGPWDVHLTVTNGAETVVNELVPILQGRRLLCFDSDGFLGELLIDGEEFAGFGQIR